MKKNIAKYTTLFFATIFLVLTLLTTLGAGTLVASDAYTTKKEVYIASMQESVIERQLDKTTNRIFDNESINDFESSFEKMNVNFKIEVQDEKNKPLYSNIDKKVDELPSYKISRFVREKNGEIANEELLTVFYEIDETYPVKDGLRFATELMTFGYDIKEFVVMISFILGIVTLLFFSLYVYTSKTDLTWIDKIPSDIYLTLVIILVTILSLIMVSVLENLQYNTYEIYVFVNYIIAVSFIGIVSFKSLIVRILHKNLLSNSIIGMIFRNIFGSISDFTTSIKNVYRDQDSKKVVLFIIIFILAQFPLFLLTGFLYPIIFMIEIGYGLYRLMIFLEELDRVKKLGHNIAHGQLDDHGVQIYTDPKLKDLAENLLKIQEGVKVAVDNELKNERLKTELITNVSHDLKTPLTAIISYLDLLEHADTKETEEYMEILTKQSQRMKKLIDDLLEMSKVSSKTIPVNKINVDLGLLLNQVVGEYQDKYDEKNLELILGVGENLPQIMTDPDLMWRVFSNVFSNAYRYSKEGTRVYVDLEHNENSLEFRIKNTSSEQLNISSDELMERFVQGDRSRNTEGSGLGLSIVGNILEILDHRYKISIDGDLFKFEIIVDIDA
ncbi:cell wall metabolism sensor histidine kinase WalK [Erysipelothrix urinaevulpis]|uniref:sensor histidine kinase n=1 Tax=Erysipelothrix urinaevulpis TaxID=2683717 RepID=UPI00135705C6|nr:HAMP domain-containing sensor histidine kinase [Erysipelothrix urinaevulpis]